MCYNTHIKVVIELKVIMISGKAESGKDFVCDVMRHELEQQHKTVLVARFADYLKFMCRQYFGWDGNKDERGRTLLQHIGTGLFRQYDENYFANRIVELLKVCNIWDYVIIPDLRFESELHTIHANFDAVAIRVNRDGYFNKLTKEQREDISETELDNHPGFDYTINTTDAAEKKQQALMILEDIING